MSTTNLGLITTSFPTDGGKTVEQWILELTGASNSNMTKVDDYAGETDGAINEIKGAGWTTQTIKGNADAIATLNGRVTYTVSPSGTNTLTATISQITTPLVNSIIKLIPTANNTGAMTLNVNGEGALPVTKVRTISGSLVYSAMEANDFRIGSQVLVTKSSDGVRWISLTHGEIFARNLYYDNGDGTYSTVQSKLDEATIPDSNAITLDKSTKVVTVTDSYASPSDMVIGGETLYNAVTNGDFSGGTTGWTSGSVTGFTVVGGVAEFTANAVNGNIYQQISPNGSYANKKVFFKSKVATSSSVLKLILTDGVGQTELVCPVSPTLTDVYGIRTVSASASILAIFLLDPRTSGWTKTYADDFIAIPMTGTPYEAYTADQMNGLVNKYIDKLQGAKAVTVGSRGRNLFDKTTLTYDKALGDAGELISAVGFVASDFIRVSASTNYIKKTTTSRRVVFYDRNKLYIGRISTTSQFTTPANCEYIKLEFSLTGDGVTVDNFNVNVGTVLLAYEPYQGSQATISATRNKLPNGIEDTLSFI